MKISSAQFRALETAAHFGSVAGGSSDRNVCLSLVRRGLLEYSHTGTATSGNFGWTVRLYKLTEEGRRVRGQELANGRRPYKDPRQADIGPWAGA